VYKLVWTGSLEITMLGGREKKSPEKRGSLKVEAGGRPILDCVDCTVMRPWPEDDAAGGGVEEEKLE
jgi:hypothetical protein